MKNIKRILSIMIVVALLVGICAMSTLSSNAGGTGTGLAEWALNAYYSKWSYVYGGSSAGAVDCSGLIYSYAGGQRTGDAQLYNSNYTGSISSGVPRIHGLGLWKPGHVGVYVGDGMAVDARGSQWGVCYESVYTHGWTKYFKVPGVSYPTNGWVNFNGSKYYYENGQYVVNTTKTINGVSYTFSASGKCSSNGSVAPSTSTSSSTSSSSSTSLKKGSTGDRVIKLQQRLSELGYYNGVIDGSFGEGTEKAFKLFQEQAGLYVDGIAGNDINKLYADDAPKYEPEEEVSLEINNNKSEEDTAVTSAQNKPAQQLESINGEDEQSQTATETTEEVKEETPTSFSKGDYHEEIAKFQKRLSDLGYYEGTADGSFGTQTESAVKVFQGANGITQSGVADEFTLKVLYSNTAAKNPIPASPAEELEVVNSELPESAQRVNANASINKANTTNTPATEVTLETNKLSEKALAGFSDTMSFESDANGNNFQFIFWLAVMIIIMSIAFIVVHTIEKKKLGKKTSGKYF